MERLDVVIPEMAIAPLTYESPVSIPEGVRVIVEVGKTLHVGFVLGRSVREVPAGVKLKPIAGVIDGACVIGDDVFDLAKWAARVCMCGVGAVLKNILPRDIYIGEKSDPPPKIEHGEFHERTFFSPFDSERGDFYLSEITREKRTLILFPTQEAAKKFSDLILKKLHIRPLLWSSREGKPFHFTWEFAKFEDLRVIVGSQGAVFAPFSPEKIIIDDEQNPAYILKKSPKISARSLAGHRAQYLGAELITAGRMPSLKTYLRTHPDELITPERKNIILVDIYRSHKEQAPGIEGHIPLTFSLIKHTYRELSQKHNVMWILNRSGESSEVFCEKCGQVVKCEKCGGVMQSTGGGNVLRCRVCGHLKELPPKCESCGCDFFMGRRPGLEALGRIAEKYYHDVHVEDGRKGLILTTQKGLSLLGRVKPGLVAWLDLDAELWRPEHTTRYNAFSMLYESYWRGRTRDSQRKLLIQSRSSGMRLARFMLSGWSKFLDDELRERREFMLPPYGYIVEVEDRKPEVLKVFEEAGVFVMDPGDDEQPLYIYTQSLDTIDKILAANFKKYPKITIRSE